MYILHAERCEIGRRDDTTHTHAHRGGGANSRAFKLCLARRRRYRQPLTFTPPSPNLCRLVGSRWGDTVLPYGGVIVVGIGDAMVRKNRQHRLSFGVLL